MVSGSRSSSPPLWRSRPAVYVARRSASKRLAAFAEALPDTLQLLAGSLRAGFSLVQAVGAVAQEAAEPMATQLQLAFNENRLGRPIEDALDDVAIRMESADLAWVVMAIRIQREVGGNLAELLDTVADTMAQRERVRREIKRPHRRGPALGRHPRRAAVRRSPR